MKRIYSLSWLICLSVFAPAVLANNPADSSMSLPQQKPMWVDVGLGPVGDGRFVGFGMHGNFSMLRPAGLYTIQFLYSESIATYQTTSGPIPPGEIREESPKTVSSLAGYYGWLWKKKYGYAAGSVGVSVIRKYYEEYTIPPVQKTNYLVGIPLLGQICLTPLPFIGIGIAGNYIFTAHRGLMLVHLSLEIGRLR